MPSSSSAASHCPSFRLSTAVKINASAPWWPPEQGLRLATVGPGMVFGEMAFLNGSPRSASAGAERGAARLVRLSRAHFDAWAGQHPGAALHLMNNLAQMGARRLAVTTRQLRAVLE